MTMESRQPEAAGSGAGLVRSAAPSPADLWNEILQRLSEVQEGQLRLARAIESLGMIVCDALAVNPQAMLAGSETTSLPAHGAARLSGCRSRLAPVGRREVIWPPRKELSIPSSPPTSSSRPGPDPTPIRTPQWRPRRPPARSARPVSSWLPSGREPQQPRANPSRADPGPGADASPEASAARHPACPHPPSSPISRRRPSMRCWPPSSVNPRRRRRPGRSRRPRAPAC